MEVSLRVFFPEPPAFAEAAPTRAVYVGDVDGRCEVFTWDSATRRSRQVTDRPQGTVTAALDPAGQHVWWFDDDLSGVGEWRAQPWDGGPDLPALPGVPAGRAAGLAMGPDGTVAAGFATPGGLSVHLARPGGVPDLVATGPAGSHLVDLAGGTLALAGEPDGPDAVRLVRPGGPDLLLSGVDSPLWPVGFDPAGAGTLLLAARRGNTYRLALWTAGEGLRVLGGAGFGTEISPGWYPDGRRALVRQDRYGRSTLHEVDLASGAATLLPTPAGSILSATRQPDGDLHYVWTSTTRPALLRSRTGPRLPGGPEPHHPGRYGEVWADGPGGPVHALLTLPDRDGPHPAVFWLHGGPYDAARDAYDAAATLFASIGCAVVRPNYRGSTGYGAAWRRAVNAAPGVGLAQLEDLAAVQDRLVADGVIRAGQVAVCGESWGGYLALLAAGAQPDRWQAAAGINPVADYPGAFAGTTDRVRALDTALFGGTPEQVPARYHAASPLSYVDAVRAPVLLVAGSADPVCPPDQVRRYAAALAARGGAPELHWIDSGHQRLDAAVHAEVLGTVVRFVGTALGGKQAPAGAR
jgi:dipeptidyl aminopeptidase/acylaminoacyl peptidase